MATFKEKVMSEIHSEGFGHHHKPSKTIQNHMSKLQKAVSDSNSETRDPMTYGRVRIIMSQDD